MDGFHTSTTYACNVVIDLEFSPIPPKRRQNGLRYEIIEVGAVKLLPDGSIVGEFSHMVRPTMSLGVSSKVHHLTGIDNRDLVGARPLDEVLAALSEWVGKDKARMITWSSTDLKQIQQECAAKGIQVELPSRWMDLQRLYTHLMGLSRGRKVALAEAAKWLGVKNNPASAHRAIYDAQVTASVFRMMGTGVCSEHRVRVREELRKADPETPCQASIADRCSGLAELLEALKAKEAAA